MPYLPSITLLAALLAVLGSTAKICVIPIGVYIISCRTFKCSLDNAKRYFHRIALKAIFRKVGRTAHEEVTLQLVASKCLPLLMYGTEACQLTKADTHSLDCMLNRCVMRLF
jgi:hypothetical protein